MKMEKYEELISFIRSSFNESDAFIPLHEPRFIGNERKYILDAIDSTFVSSVGQYVNRFEELMCELTGAKYAIATVNGTAALHTCLILAGVQSGDEVITQSLSFIATANAISYCGASPIFIDVDIKTMGLSPESLKLFLEKNAVLREGQAYNQISGKRIGAVVPMHTFGHPVRIDEIVQVCDQYNIAVVEDAAESLGSYYKERHTGIFGKLGAFSFNGNKTVTCGGGGAIVTNDPLLATRAKHITTTAKVPHPWEYTHDEIGYNYRMPNLNAAMACAQLEKLYDFVIKKRVLASEYISFGSKNDIKFVEEPKDAKSNYWLNAICTTDRNERDLVLSELNENGVMCRPIWTLLHKMPMFSESYKDEQLNAQWLEDRIVNVPSSVIF
ncbi:MAG: perosamine synthetase [Cyclobacteriaceae bacterium]|jgi:aminotransferase in exopolysaccharide biosynthesis